MLAAGGIGNGRQVASAMAMGAAGVWTGSLWLTVEEADVPPAQMQTYLDASSHDTVRSRAFTGKPCRMLRNDWTDAWEARGHPRPAADAAADDGGARRGDRGATTTPRPPRT